MSTSTRRAWPLAGRLGLRGIPISSATLAPEKCSQDIAPSYAFAIVPILLRPDLCFSLGPRESKQEALYSYLKRLVTMSANRSVEGLEKRVSSVHLQFEHIVLDLDCIECVIWKLCRSEDVMRGSLPALGSRQLHDPRGVTRS